LEERKAKPSVGEQNRQRPRRASARLVAAAESALPPLLRALGGDLLRHVVKFVDDADLPCLRLTCKALRDHSSKPEMKCRLDFMRMRALVAFAWASMPGFVRDLPSMLVLAASVGCVGVLAELVDKRQCPLTAGVCEAAAGKGRLDALVWLHSRGCPWDIETCWRAALGGNLEVLSYAHEHGCPWDSDTCMIAAVRGHLEVLRYAHEHGIPWHVGTCYIAAEGGHLEVLRYAHEHGYPLPMQELEFCRAKALAGGHAEVVEYLRTAQPTA
jgi:hypothetical protein